MSITQCLIAEGALYALTGIDAYRLGVSKYLAMYFMPAFLTGIAMVGDAKAWFR